MMHDPRTMTDADRIEDARDLWPRRRKGQDLAEQRRAFVAGNVGGRHPMRTLFRGVPEKVHPTRTVFARIEHNRWIAGCECGGAERVTPELPTLFCAACLNVGSDGLLVRVVFPDGEKRAQVERLLLEREPINRNWYPHETVAVIEAENRAHRGALKRGV